MQDQTPLSLNEIMTNLKRLPEEERLILFAQMLQKQAALEAEMQWMRNQLAQILNALQKWEASEDPPAELTESEITEIDRQLAELYSRTDKLRNKLNPLLPQDKRISTLTRDDISPSA